MKKFYRLFALIMALVTCVAALSACGGGEKEDKYLEAFEMIEEKNYEKAYAIFVELGDYKNAEREASKFRYVPVSRDVKYTDDDGSIKNETYTFSYNENNLISQRVFESDDTTLTAVCTYDKSGRLTKISVSDKYSMTNEYECFYDDRGCLVKEVYTYLGGDTFVYEHFYDEKLNNIKSVYSDGQTTEIAELSYREDGNVSNIVRKDADGKVISTEEFLYDEKGRNVRSDHTADGEHIGFVEYTYNEKDQLVKEYYGSETSYTREHFYDANGNVVKTHETDENGFESTVETSFNFVYVPFEYAGNMWEYLLDKTVD